MTPLFGLFKENNPDKPIMTFAEKEKQDIINKIKQEGGVNYEITSDLIIQENRVIFFKSKIYIFSEHNFKHVEDDFINSEIEKLIGSDTTNKVVSEILGKIKRKSNIYEDEFENHPETIIPLKNGLLDLTTKSLISYEQGLEKGWRWLKYFNVDYNPRATSKIFISALNNNLDKNQQELLKQFFGYVILRTCKYKKALMLVGVTDGGKTIILKVLTNLIGVDNLSTRSLQDVCNDRFSMASLYGKALNYYDDLTLDKIEDIGRFKIATGDGYANVEEKFKNSFPWKVTTKLIFACNKVPEAKKDDEAYYNRWLIIFFNRPIPPEKRIFGLAEKCNTPEELSGVLNWALEGADNLLDKNAFSFNLTTEEVKDLMQLSSTHLLQYVKNNILPNENSPDYINKDVVYQDYCAFCYDNNVNVNEMLTESRFKQNFPKYATMSGLKIQLATAKITGRRVQVYRGIKLKTEREFKDDSDISEEEVI